jgi:hypothetical protein
MNVLAGQTVRVVNTFSNFEGNPQDPNLVKFKVYDKKYALLDEQILGDSNKLEEGKYFVDYVTPQDPNQKYILEFYGEISGNPTFEREVIYTSFVR